jgi:hypothetical protein
MATPRTTVPWGEAAAGDVVTASPPAVGARALRGLLGRPDLWLTAVRTGLAVVDPGWWRRWPPRPRPPEAYATFRHQTMFGVEPGPGLGGDDLVAYLDWCRRMRALR